MVFSAQAEVFPVLKRVLPIGTRFLRASGGVSSLFQVIDHFFGFSPRKRRCFCELPQAVKEAFVFSAQAEVFPCLQVLSILRPSFLRASGGVSKSFMIYIEVDKFSPRKRRCFQKYSHAHGKNTVFSAQAEVFPRNHHRRV